MSIVRLEHLDSVSELKTRLVVKLQSIKKEKKNLDDSVGVKVMSR